MAALGFGISELSAMTGQPTIRQTKTLCTEQRTKFPNCQRPYVALTRRCTQKGHIRTYEGLLLQRRHIEPLADKIDSHIRRYGQDELMARREVSSMRRPQRSRRHAGIGQSFDYPEKSSWANGTKHILPSDIGNQIRLEHSFR